ncbi:hypothetical protein BH09GEM1_BH09GEM1_34870 [soil metagenome]
MHISEYLRDGGLEPDRNPTAVFVKSQVGHQIGSPG